jgi:DNA-binding transcriptional MerR regulator
VNSTVQLLNASEAAKRLGVSTRALRLYEERGLLQPPRTAAGWRTYGPEQMLRARGIVELRTLGLSLVEVARALDGDTFVLARALTAHEVVLEARMRQLRDTVHRIHTLREKLDREAVSVASALTNVRQAGDPISVAIDLPWPWGGERFELREVCRLTHIVGPLGSGKTRLARRLADAIKGASFVGLDRLGDGAAAAKERLASDPQLELRVRHALAAIAGIGGNASDALVALLTALETEGPVAQVIDMLEDGLDAPTQEALICFLRRRRPSARPLLFLTRSSFILDVDAVGPDEAIILCPANHNPPMLVAPYRGAPGYEALTMCLATPDVRARTEGVIATRRGG